MRTILLLAALAVACADDKTTNENPAPLPSRGTATSVPDRITIDHILIGMPGPRMPIQRTEAEARAIAADVLKQLESGASWDELKRAHSDDPPVKSEPRGGPYTLDRTQAKGNMAMIQKGVYAKDDMVPAFGDVGYTLEIEEIAVARYSPTTSPFGFHIIKRLK